MNKSKFYINNPYIMLFRLINEITVGNSDESIVWVGYNDWLAREKKQLDVIGINFSAVLTERITRDLFNTFTNIHTIDYSQELVNDNNIYLLSQSNDLLVNQLISNGISKDKIYKLPTIEELANICSEKEKRDIGNGIRLGTRQIQSITLKILHNFSQLCEEKGYKYYLDGGTLLGAVRHKGFIPWDDDVDVYMPYEDYCKLRNEYTDSDDFELLSWDRTAGYPFQFAKIVDKNTYMIHDGGICMGVYIDIFPLVEYPDDIDSIYNLWCDYSKWDRMWNEFNLCSAVGVNVDDIREDIEKKRAYSGKSGVNVGDILYLLQKPWTTRREVFDKFVMLPFEKYQFRCPEGYDIYLTERYGDYMKLPPIEQRMVHSFPAYASKKYVKETYKKYKISFDFKYVIKNTLFERILIRLNIIR